ncbi:hypothetical protein [Mycolicibacterium sphagni]|uniref:Uncharacterized protein n=2 Tax=Mycolicibacterium sphagni TaxID=1786 RepID=A0A255D902_9MYCO|nr:hypothetical protein [Mycolicibacterium sphagni]OYN75724.1 hypothetical protein CG716_24125 [Mycolicibacterium sphagni]
MLTMRDHDVEDYTVLADMDATDVGVLSAEDQACLDEIGQYLVATDTWQRFAIWLLHKHFEPAPGEVFVEAAVHAPRGTRTTPRGRAAVAAVQPTSVRFDTAGVVGMEFADPGDFGDTDPFGDQDATVLAGIAERLGTHGKIDRFGVRLIRNPLGLTDAEVLHETCDTSHRTLNCTVGNRSEFLADDNTIQTAWRWKVVEGSTQPMVMQDCTVVCVRAGEGHDIQHNNTPPGGGF